MARDEHEKLKLSFRRRITGGKCLQAGGTAGAGARRLSSTGKKMPNNSEVKATADDIRERLLQASASAFQTLLELLENAETDTVRLRAAQDILDRAGFKPVDKREVSGVSSVVNTSVDYSDPAAVAARIAELKKRLEEAKNSCNQVKDGDRQVN